MPRKLGERLIPISSIFIDEELYPRNKEYWYTVNRYAAAMKAGATFPSIRVAKYNGEGYEYILVDGRHRIGAHIRRKEGAISAEIYSAMEDHELFIQSIKLNQHGLPFSAQDTSQQITKLQSFGISIEQISEIVSMPADKIEMFQADRVVYPRGQREPIHLKASLRHLRGGRVRPEINDIQERMHANHYQNTLLDELLELIDEGLLNVADDEIRGKMALVYRWCIDNRNSLPRTSPSQSSRSRGEAPAEA